MPMKRPPRPQAGLPLRARPQKDPIAIAGGITLH